MFVNARELCSGLWLIGLSVSSLHKPHQSTPLQPSPFSHTSSGIQHPSTIPCSLTVQVVLAMASTAPLTTKMLWRLRGVRHGDVARRTTAVTSCQCRSVTSSATSTIHRQSTAQTSTKRTKEASPLYLGPHQLAQHAFFAMHRPLAPPVAEAASLDKASQYPIMDHDLAAVLASPVTTSESSNGHSSEVVDLGSAYEELGKLTIWQVQTSCYLLIIVLLHKSPGQR